MRGKKKERKKVKENDKRKERKGEKEREKILVSFSIRNKKPVSNLIVIHVLISVHRITKDGEKEREES